MGLQDQLIFANSLARVGVKVAREKLRPASSGGDSVPLKVEGLTEEWLTEALCRDHPAAQVTGFELLAGSEGTTTRRSLRIEYNWAGVDAALPTAVFSKSAPRFLSRVLVGITGIGAGEALFYETIRRHLEIGAPAGYFGRWDELAWRYLVLTEDVSVTRGATFPREGIQVDRSGAECMIREMAHYHGAFWEDPRLDEWTVLADPYVWQLALNRRAGCDLGAIAAFRWLTAEIPHQLRSRKSEIRGALMRSLAVNVRGPKTLLHQDTHPRNWFKVPDGSVYLYDWQAIAKGNWALDVSYALSSVLDTADRRSWERELLELYLDELGSAGGNPPSFAEAWLAYRQQMIHGFVFWAYTSAVNRVREVHPEDVTRTIVARTAQAMVDLETLDAID